jgi:uncharacterized protein
MWALASGSAEGARALLEAGANPNLATQARHGDARGETAVILTAGGDHPELLELLLQFGGDPDVLDAVGDPALTVSIMHHRPEQLRLLIRAGADLNQKGSDGDTPAMVAATS